MFMEDERRFVEISSLQPLLYTRGQEWCYWSQPFLFCRTFQNLFRVITRLHIINRQLISLIGIFPLLD